MIILGIDPGFAIVGVGIIEYKGNKFRVIDYFAITTKAHTPIEQRLKIIYDGINEAIHKYKPDFMAVEELFFNNNAKTAIAVGQARGVILLSAVNLGVPFFEYTPLQVKQAVAGYGRADKNQVQQMVKAILNLPAVPKPDDVADALAIAVCHAHSFKMVKLENK
ncbi:MAG: crossover junction endodeoxyribonuclease RuvC [Clostridia bacterium]|nr:crossover junction endodeoxyribonuclease RuvC [Clostridia bacterium]MBO7288808.1 crossover junction endodeoxyribonuclease RuvC [Clostridia bacterium]